MVSFSVNLEHFNLYAIIVLVLGKRVSVGIHSVKRILSANGLLAFALVHGLPLSLHLSAQSKEDIG